MIKFMEYKEEILESIKILSDDKIDKILHNEYKDGVITLEYNNLAVMKIAKLVDEVIVTKDKKYFYIKDNLDIRTNNLIQKIILDYKLKDLTNESKERTLENKSDEYSEDEETWTKQDLIELIQEQDLNDEDIIEITDLVMDIVEYGDFDWDDSHIYEKMSTRAKKEAQKKRRKPAFKRAMKKKLKCQKKYAEKIKKSKDSGTPMVCNIKGKLVKGMNRAERRKLAKSRLKNRNKIIN